MEAMELLVEAMKPLVVMVMVSNASVVAACMTYVSIC
jgi:hypothetical protein